MGGIMYSSTRIDEAEYLDNYEHKDWENLFMIHKFALEQISTQVNILKEELMFTKDHNPIEHVKTRIKSPISLKNKLERLNFDITIENAKKYITDISGMRIICSFKNDIYFIADMLKNQDDIEIVRISDYVINPKPNGYRSYHMIVKVPVCLSNEKVKVNVEIQIRTSAMDFWASLEHKIYYKYHNNKPVESVDLELVNELKDCAMISAELDDRMSIIKEKLHYKREVAMCNKKANNLALVKV